MTAIPPPELVATIRAIRLTHQPSMQPGEILSARPCTGCTDTWPCPRYRNAQRMETEAFRWAWEAIAALPDRYADRVPAGELTQVRRYTGVGEWDEALELLVAVLRKFHVSVTDTERAELRHLGQAMRITVHLPEDRRRAARRSI